MFLITRVKCVKCARYVNISNNVLLFVHITTVVLCLHSLQLHFNI